MDIRTTIEVNKQIMELIESKYDQLFPATYITPESSYYKRLRQDTQDAERYLTYAQTK